MVHCNNDIHVVRRSMKSLYARKLYNRSIRYTSCCLDPKMASSGSTSFIVNIRGGCRNSVGGGGGGGGVHHE